MTLAIMQPYFFPFLDHFRLMAAADQWIVFDTVVYRRKTFMSRNRIINRDKGWAYISVPVQSVGRDEIVSNVEVADDVPWREAILDKLRVYEKTAPFHDETMALVESVLGAGETHLVGANVAGLSAVRDHLGIVTPMRRLSEMDIEFPDEVGPGEWALRICEVLGADAYINPAGGRDLFDPTQFVDAGIELSFLEPAIPTYDTGPFAFEPGLSIIDTLMWLGRDQAASLVHDSGSQR